MQGFSEELDFDAEILDALDAESDVEQNDDDDAGQPAHLLPQRDRVPTYLLLEHPGSNEMGLA